MFLAGKDSSKSNSVPSVLQSLELFEAGYFTFERKL